MAALLESVRTPDAIAIGEWSIGDTAAHVSQVLDVEAKVVRGEGSSLERLDQLEGFNAQLLREDPERDPAAIAERLEPRARELIEALTAGHPDDLVTWHGGIKVPRLVPGAIIVNELLLHGFDIARAAGRPWPMDRAYAALGIEGASPLLPYYVDEVRAAGVKASYEVRLRADRRRLFVTVDDGQVSLDEPPGGKVDCRISADPVAFLLVGYGRISQVGPILRGQMLAWGRKPWLAPKLATMLRSI